jgi:hypothetical protein
MRRETKMTDHIEALERLQRLRESGALTDAEFEREKERLLQSPAAAAPRPPPWIWIAGGAVAIVLAALLVMMLLRREGPTQGNETASANIVASPAPEANLAAPAPVEAGIRTRRPAEQLAAAFRAGFGRDRRAMRRVNGAEVTYAPGGLRWIGDRAVLVSPGRSSEDCHACPGFVAVHYLQAEGNGFRPAGEWLSTVRGGTFGQVPGWEFSTLLSDQPMVAISSGGMWQGIVCSGSSYYELGANGPREVAGFLTGMDSSGSGIVEAASFEGRVRNVVKDRSFDVVYTGSQRFTEHYEWRGGRYVLAGGGESRAIC